MRQAFLVSERASRPGAAQDEKAGIMTNTKAKHFWAVAALLAVGLSALLARTAVRQCFGSGGDEEFGELYFDDRSGKSLPLGTFCRFAR